MTIPCKQCPCKGCICIPICRHKDYTQLTKDCITIRNHHNECVERDHQDFFFSICAIEDALKPTKWVYKSSGVSKRP